MMLLALQQKSGVLEGMAVLSHSNPLVDNCEL